MPATIGVTTNLEVAGTLTTSTLRSYSGVNLTLGCTDGGAAITITTSTLAISFAGAATFTTDVTVNGITVGRGSGNFVSNVVFGNGAFASNSTATYCVAIGDGALASSTEGSGQVAIGDKALNAHNYGLSNNTAVGSGALMNSTGGYYNVAIGSAAGYSNVTGYQNVAIGVSAGKGDNVSSVAVGHESLFSINTITSGNIAIGYHALRNKTSGGNNTAIGFGALRECLTGAYNVAIGYQAGRYETGSYKFYVDAVNRSTESGCRAGALMYGVFDATPANQTLAINAAVTISGTVAASNIVTTATANGIVKADSLGKIDVNWIPTDELQIILRQGSDAERQTIVFSEGEPIWTTDTHQLWLGDGSTLGGIAPGFNATTLTGDNTISRATIGTGTGGWISCGEKVYIAAGSEANPVGTIFTLSAPASGSDTLMGVFGSTTLLGGTSFEVADFIQLWSGASWSYFYYNTDWGRWANEGDSIGSPSRNNWVITATNQTYGLRVFRRGTTSVVLTISNRLGTDLSIYGGKNVMIAAHGGSLWLGSGEFVSDLYGNIGIGCYGKAIMPNRITATQEVVTVATTNVAIGMFALNALTSGDSNIGIGTNAGQTLQTGQSNFFLGHLSGGACGAAVNYNIVIGYGAGGAIAGDYNTLLGRGAGVACNANNVMLGSYAGCYETGSDSFYVNNQNRTNTAGDKASSLLYGTFHATAASQTLRVNGSLSTLGSLTVDSNLTVSGTGSHVFGTTNTVTLAAGNVTATGNVTASDVILGTSGPSVKSSLAARAPAQGIVSTGVAVSTTSVAGQGSGNLSVHAKVAFARAVGSNEGIISGAGGGALEIIRNTSGQIEIRSTAVGTAAYTDGTPVSVVGKMYDIVVTRSSGVWQVYVDGVAVTTTTSSDRNFTGTNDVIGGGLGLGVAQIRIHALDVLNRALSAAEVLAMYERGAVDPSDINSASNTSLVTGDASTFASDSGYWTIVGGGVSITGGKAVIGAAGNALRKTTGLVKAGYKYRATFTVSDFTGTGTVALQGQGATLYLAGTADGTFTGEFTAVEDSIQFQSTGDSTCKIDNVLVYPLGALLAPDATQPGAGTTWRDISGNSAHITLGTGCGWALPSSGYIGGNLQTASGRVVKVTPDTTATFNFTTTDHCVVLYYATALVANLQAAATAGTGRHYYVYNRGAGQATITPSSGEKINGDSTFILASQETMELVCTGITGAEWAAF